MGTPLGVRTPAVATNGALTTVLVDEGARSSGGDSIASANFIPDSTQAAQGATNFCTLQLRQIRAGASLGVVGTLNLGTVGLTAETPAAFTLQAPAQPWQAGDEIDLNVAQTGTGGAVPAGLVDIELA